ncbi:hypothetical protein, partial [Streptococcus dysgalactiae]|uniref:hypothetical protein n=1 Tax=Streptococcus dysgalactiae TaxID=1334 RepID=UPI001951350B
MSGGIDLVLVCVDDRSTQSGGIDPFLVCVVDLSAPFDGLYPMIRPAFILVLALSFLRLTS